MKTRGEALREYVLRRFLLMVPTFIGITFATFLLVQFVNCQLVPQSAQFLPLCFHVL